VASRCHLGLHLVNYPYTEAYSCTPSEGDPELIPAEYGYGRITTTLQNTRGQNTLVGYLSQPPQGEAIYNNVYVRPLFPNYDRKRGIRDRRNINKQHAYPSIRGILSPRGQ
jgi:hypothetical protein